MSSRPSRGAARLAAILDALPDALVLVNANGTVVNANTIALEAFETPGTALVGRGLLDLLPQFDSKLIPGSMRRPDHIDPRARTKPTRMIARRTDGSEFPVEVTSANLENGQQAYDGYGYTSDELLMLVVRDLSGTVDTEAELARSQRQTEMILRAASEGVVGTDTDGRIVLVNPAAAQILGYRASDLGGRELHTLVLHSRPDGSPFPYEESPLADTLRSGRKHRVRGQVLFAKNGGKVPVDLTTAPVRDGDQLVGAVMTFTDRRPYDALAKDKQTEAERHAEELERVAEEHASELTALRQQHVTELEQLREQHEEELAAGEERYAALGEREKDRYEALAARHEQLLTLLGGSLRGPLEELRRDLSALAADDAGQLWPEANQVLHHLSAGYSRITTLIDNVLGYQRLDTGAEQISRTKVMLDAVVASGVDGAVELIGPGRVQFAVHAPPIEAEVDPRLLATALAHLVADVAGVDATGNAPVSASGYMDNTVVVAAAQRGEVVRIEVRGPYAGGDPVHEPIVRGIVRAHGGVLQTHEVPGMSGRAFVLEVPLGGGAGAVAADAGAAQAEEAAAQGGQTSGGGRRRARRSSVDAFLESDAPGEGGATDGAGSGATGASGTEAAAPTGRRRRRAVEGAAPVPAQASGEAGAAGAASGEAGAAGAASGGTGRRRGRPAEDAAEADAAGVSEGAVVTAAEHAAGAAATGSGLGGTVPPQGVPAPTGRRARRDGGEQHALPPALPAPSTEVAPAEAGQPTGRRRRALAAANERAAAQEASPRQVFALPPAEADQGVAAQGSPAEQVVGQGQQGAPQIGAPQTGPASGDGGDGPGNRQGQQGPGPSGQGPGPVPAPGHVHGQGQGPVPGQGQVPGQGHGQVPGSGQVPELGHQGQGAAQEQDQVHGAGQPQGLVPVQGQGQVQGGQSPAQVQGQPQGLVPVQGPGPVQGQGQPQAQGQLQGQAQLQAAQGQAQGQGMQVPGPAVSGDVPLDDGGRHDAVPHDQADDHTPPQPHPASAPTGRRRRAVAQPTQAPGAPAQPGRPAQAPQAVQPAQPAQGAAAQDGPAQPVPNQAVVGQTATNQAVPHQAAAPHHPVPAQETPGQDVPAQAAGAQGAPGQGAAATAPHGTAVPAAVPPQAAHAPVPAQGTAGQGVPGAAPGQPVQQPQPGPAQQAVAADQGAPAPHQAPAQAPNQPLPTEAAPTQGTPAQGNPAQGTPPHGAPAQQIWPEADNTQGEGMPVPPQQNGTAAPVPPDGTAQPPAAPVPPQPNAPHQTPAQGTPGQGVPAQAAQPLPAEAAAAPVDPNSTQGRAISVRTLGQGVPFNRQAAQAQAQAQAPNPAQARQPSAPPAPHPSATPPPHQTGGSGRRRKLGTPPDPAARPHPQGEQTPAQPQQPQQAQQQPQAAQPSLAGQSRLAPATEGSGRSYAIGAPDENAAEGPEPLDGPGGAIEVADPPRPQPMDDELPPEPLDNPRRLLVWPAPDVSTQQALSDRGYRPVIVHSREEVDSQIAAFPAALFVDPLTGPITRTALQSLRQAAVAAEVPILVTAGLGQASRDAAYGADPAVLLKALAPRDSEQHPPRVLLIEEHAEIALALTATLERRGMQVARAASDTDAVTLAGDFRPNLVVMDLMQLHRRRAGIVDWLRANGQLNRTPLVVYTAAVDQADLPRLASGETVLFLAERSTSNEVQSRIVELLSRIGTN
ncbi:PAS domain-containing protein [Streptomyces sp. TRM68367]|uniref:PAS domain-containing protein n=1 Tax=Streptomyces sp. TRM68367 TaxID=2758415 RepID=UPI00165B34EC|nr:PAS domain-containing protein [Streptomyces sp. TRM68367]MBC9729987.1 PAS domain-containing protein [Streptomyces sp. TRM68367]